MTPFRTLKVPPDTVRILACGLALLLSAGLVHGEEARVEIVVTGRLLEINGVADVPRGLFGVHHVPLTEKLVSDWGIELDRFITHTPDGKNARTGGPPSTADAKGKTTSARHPGPLTMVIQCLWDRYQPALRLTRKDWRDYLAGLGKAYGEDARTTGQRHYLEFWNEPYLNWATQPAVNYHEAHFDTTDIQAGKPMKLRTTEEVIPNLVWDRQVFFTLRKGGGVDYFTSGFIPREGRPGETVKLRQGRGEVTLNEGAGIDLSGPRILSYQWSGRDLTQKYYWSGEVNRGLYIEMFEAFARSLKEANPEVQLAAGWGFNMFNENWESWEVLYRPTIDALHPWFDALHEHHYGGDTRLVGASYEVAYAHTLGKHGKRIVFWNTEAGGHLDPEQPGVVKPANEGDPLTRARAAMTYFLRDVVYLGAFCPDKAAARAAHHSHENGGDEWAFKLLKPWRGKIVETMSSGAGVWSAAAVEGDRLTLVIFNDRADAVVIEPRLLPPPGRGIESVVRREVIPGMRRVEREGSPAEEPWLALEERPVVWEAGGLIRGQKCPGKSAVVFVCTLGGTAGAAAPLRWEQFVSADVLRPVAPEENAEVSIPIPEVSLQTARSARLRLVLSAPPVGIGVRINGSPVTLRPGGAWISDHPFDPGLLKTGNTLTVTAPAGQKILLAAASIYLEKP